MKKKQPSMASIDGQKFSVIHVNVPYPGCSPAYEENTKVVDLSIMVLLFLNPCIPHMRNKGFSALFSIVGRNL